MNDLHESENLNGPLIYLLDDDPIFRKIAERFAKQKNLSLCSCKNLAEFRDLWVESAPDVVIMDYDLDEDLKGPDLAHLLGGVPILLVSRKSNWIPGRDILHPSIKDFFHKKYGVPRILDKAVDLAHL